MPVQIACPKCSKRYSLPDSAFGKAVQCKACGTTFRTKKPGQPKPPVAAPSSGRPAAQDDLSQYGLDGGFKKEADIFSAPPPPPQALAGFGNFAEEDPGFDDDAMASQVKVEQEESDDQNPYKSVLSNPALRQVKKIGKKGGNKSAKIRKKHIEQEVEIQQWGIVLMGIAILSVITVAIYAVIGLMFVPDDISGDGVAIFAGIFLVILGIVALFSIFQFFVGWGMYRLNGFGRIAGTIYWGINFLNIPVGTVISFMVMRMLWNEQGTMIFSPEYKTIREETPEIKHNSSTGAVVLAFFIIGTIVMFVWPFIFGE